MYNPSEVVTGGTLQWQINSSPLTLTSLPLPPKTHIKASTCDPNLIMTPGPHKVNVREYDVIKYGT